MIWTFFQEYPLLITPAVVLAAVFVCFVIAGYEGP